ncbi:hypothetical protein [Glycomyces arizonensis]|uniref:hypothetical protein n=1 Tax=Glycomyces arizonensis TaxID=256035 RepID=UPI000423C743|nr:hypothetical protein [Glycomyces arizonensis]
MIVKDEYREQIRLMATGRGQDASELNAALPAEDRVPFNQFLSGVFAVLMDRHFKDNLNRDTLAEFSAELCRNYQNSGLKIRPLTVEGILRGSAGETHLLEGISADEIIGVQVLVIAKIAAEDPAVSSGIEQFLDEAEELVAQWEQEPGDS